MELADVELVAELLLGVRSQLLDLELTGLVRERLTRRGDVAVDLDDDVVLRLRRVGGEVVDRLLPRHALRVDAGVDDEPDRAPHLVRELAELRVRVLVEADARTEALGVQRPSFDERGVAAEATKVRYAGELLRDRDLQVVAGHRLVRRERLHLPLGARVERVRVHVVVAGAPGVVRSRLVVSGRRRLRAVTRDRRHTVRQSRQMSELVDQLRIDALHNVAVCAHEIGAVGEEELRIGAQKVRELRERALVADRLHHAVHLSANALHLREPRLVDLRGRAIGGGLNANVVRVPRGAVGESAHAYCFPRARDVALGEKGVEPFVRGLHLFRVRLYRGGGEALLVRGGDARGKARERHEHRALHRIGGEQPLHLIGDIAQRDARRRDLRLESPLQ